MSDDDWFPAAPADDVPAGEMKGVEVGGIAVALFNVDGRHYATHDICTHAHAHLSDGWFEGRTIECPLHAGQFDVTTGKGMGPPILCDLRTFPVRVNAGVIEIRLADDDAAA